MQGSAPLNHSKSKGESFKNLSAATTREDRAASDPTDGTGPNTAASSRKASLDNLRGSSTPGKRGPSKTVSGTADAKGSHAHSARPNLDEKTLHELRSTIYHSTQPFNRPDYTDHMIRERVSVQGRVRQLEPESELQGCQLKPEEIGVIKAGPIHRWLEGKAKWDERFGRKYAKIAKARERTVRRSNMSVAPRLARLAHTDARSMTGRRSNGFATASRAAVGRHPSTATTCLRRRALRTSRRVSCRLILPVSTLRPAQSPAGETPRRL